MSIKKPSFCFIAPTKYLPLVRDNAPTVTHHLVLAHLVDTCAEYADFYLSESKAGKFIMMDNSAYELKTPYAPEKLIELGQRCGAHAVVLPDYPFQPSQVTIDAAEQMIPDFKAAGLKTFFVPQSVQGDLNGWISSYLWAANHPDIDIIGMSILGIPNALQWCDPAYARVVMTHLLVSSNHFNYDKHHHYLGLNSGPALEIPSLIRLNAMDTMDSSGPVWSALLGHEYSTQTDSLQSVKKIKLPVDFNLHLSKDSATIQRIIHNITMTEQLLTNTDNTVWYANE